MSRIDALSYVHEGATVMLTSERKIGRAFDRGAIDASTEVTLYLSDGSDRSSRFAKVVDHPELSRWIEVAEPLSEPQPEQSQNDTDARPANDVSPETIERKVTQKASTRVIDMWSSARRKTSILHPSGSAPVELAPSFKDQALVEKTDDPAVGSDHFQPINRNPFVDKPWWHWTLLPLWRFVDFDGRSRRKEYWYFCALLFSLVFLAAFIGALETSTFNLIMLIALVPSLAVQVRRLHDIGISGWWSLVGFVPFVGPVALLLLSLINSKAGANEYGEPPK